MTKITRTTDGRGNFPILGQEILVSNAPVPSANIGPRSTPNYDTLANAGIKPLAGGCQVFAGPRDDPFFVDLGSAFDLLGLRPLNNFHIIPLPPTPGVDGVSGYNVHEIALQLPISSLGTSNGVIGVTGGDNAGLPNGRRLADDVVDVELRALECSYGVVGTVGVCDSNTYNQYPNNALTDGLDTDDKPFLASFPYEASPGKAMRQHLLLPRRCQQRQLVASPEQQPVSACSSSSLAAVRRSAAAK